MKCQPLLATALLLATTFSGLANPLSEEKQRSRLQALRTVDFKNMHLTPLDRAYLDTYTLLGRTQPMQSVFRRRWISANPG